MRTSSYKIQTARPAHKQAALRNARPCAFPQRGPVGLHSLMPHSCYGYVPTGRQQSSGRSPACAVTNGTNGGAKLPMFIIGSSAPDTAPCTATPIPNAQPQ